MYIFLQFKREITRTPASRLSPMQSRNEDHIVPLLQLILKLPQQLPVRVIDQHQDARPHRVVFQEQLWSLLEQVVPHPEQEQLQGPLLGLAGKDHFIFLFLKIQFILK